MRLIDEGILVTDHINDNIFVSDFVNQEKIRKAKSVIRLWGTVRERLNLYGWKLCLKLDSHEGFCWHVDHALDVGMEGDDPREPCCSMKQPISVPPGFATTATHGIFGEPLWMYMFRFMPGKPISESQVNHMMYGRDGPFYALRYDSKRRDDVSLWWHPVVLLSFQGDLHSQMP